MNVMSYRRSIAARARPGPAAAPRSGLLLGLAWALVLATGCAFDLDPAGKRCDQDHPCPGELVCVAQGDTAVCLAAAPDGGPGDGDGGGDAHCTAGSLRCSPDGESIQTCVDGSWASTACPDDTYCLLDADGVPDCVAPCDTTADCPDDTWCNPDTSRCEPRGDCTQPGVERCNASLDAVVRCDPESGFVELVAECAPDSEYCDPLDPACKPYCDDDDDCAEWPAASCDLSSRKCVPPGLCFDDQACAEPSSCIGDPGACTAPPAEEALTAGETTPELGCYQTVPVDPPADPTDCALEGRVVNFYNNQSLAAAIGLTIRIHRADSLLRGQTESPLGHTTAFDDSGLAQYRIEQLPTNTRLALEVQGRESGEFPFASLYTFGLVLRADQCTSGSIEFTAPALYQANYDSYANAAGVLADPERGLVFGRLRDCDGNKLQYGTGGLSNPHARLYYLKSGMPAPEATATDGSGFFVATNALPVRGLATALVRSGDTALSLKLRPLRVFANAASLVLFDRPRLDGP